MKTGKSRKKDSVREWKIDPISSDFKPDWQKAETTANTGLNIGHIGEQTSGKSIAALQYGYLDLDYENELVRAGFEDIAQALKDGTIPEVKKIKRLESELDSGQMNRSIEKGLIGEIWDKKVNHVKIKPASDDMILHKDGVEHSEEGLNLINRNFALYMNTFEELAKNKDPTTACIIDSMTLFKYLIDVQCSLIWEARAREGDEQWTKGVNSNKWVRRNKYNRKALLLLRSVPGWTILTFREVENSDWVVREYGADRTKLDWTKDAGFQMDMVYHFTKDRMNNNQIHVRAMPKFCRYLYEGEDSAKYTDFDIDTGSRLSIFPAIQGILKQKKKMESDIHW
jgi:hypothetical protein